MTSSDEQQAQKASSTTAESVADAIGAGREVEKLLRLSVLRVADTDVVVAAKVALTGDPLLREAAEALCAIKDRITAAVPEVTSVFVEPDVYRPSKDPAPATDVFVLRSAD